MATPASVDEAFQGVDGAPDAPLAQQIDVGEHTPRDLRLELARHDGADLARREPVLALADPRELDIRQVEREPLATQGGTRHSHPPAPDHEAVHDELAPPVPRLRGARFGRAAL